MNDQTLDTTSTISLNGATIIPIKVDTTKLFGTNKVKFQISIKNNSIVLESPKILADLDIQDKHLIKEIINVN